MALTIYYTAFHPAYFTRSCEKGPGNGRFSQMVRAFCEFRSERKKRTTSGGCPQFPKRFSEKLPFHLTSNRNFRIFWLNGKHPVIHFLKEYKPRSCVTLQLIDARDGKFSGKHWKVILYQFVLDSTAVNARVGSFTTLHIIIHIIQHALSD